MLRRYTHQSRLIFAAFLFMLSYPAIAQQRISSIWTGQGSDNNYSNTDNWSPPMNVPPKNFGPFIFDVNIPAGTARNTIHMDLEQCLVGSFVLGEGKTFRIVKDKDYTVTGQADIYGIIDGDGGDFTAIDAAFPGNKVQILADSGSVIILTGDRATEYSSTGLTAGATLMSAKGVGSRLDLSAVTNFDAAFDSPNSNTHVHAITATEGGQIDLSGVQTIVAPMDYEDRLNILVNDGAIDLSSLRELKSSRSGYTRFQMTNSDSMALPSLESIAKTMFLLSNGAQLYANGERPISYSSLGFTSGGTMISATGAGTVLDLSSVSSLDAGFNSPNSNSHIQKIISAEGGHINLSGVGIITAPADREDSLAIELDNGSIDLSSLNELSTKGAGFTHFKLSNSDGMMLPALGTATNVLFELQNSSEMTLASLENLVNARFELIDGAQCRANGDKPISYSSTGLTAGAILMSAKGVGSRLDLSAITNFDAAFDSPNSNMHVHAITATEGGQIDLSGVQTIVAPMDYEDRLNILVNDGAIDLSSLRELKSSRSGYTRFQMTNSDSMALPSLESIAKTMFLLSNGAQLYANGERPISYSSLGFTSGGTMISATGAGTVLDLSSVSSLDTGFDSPNSNPHIQKIISAEGGHVNLSSVGTLTSPVDKGDMVVLDLDGGSINLSSLQSVRGSGGGSVRISMENGSLLHTDSVVALTGFHVDLSGGSLLTAKGLRTTKFARITLNDTTDLLEITGDLDLSAATEISNDGHATLILGGDLTYPNTDPLTVPFGESTVFFAGPGPQEIELAGLDVMTYPVEFLQDDNFGYDQLVIGQPNEPTSILLVDRIDNGLRGGFDGPDGEAAEALYLFGKNGEDGLYIQGGSTLYLNGLHVYARLDGVYTDLNDLFGPDESKIAFDEGWICKGSGPSPADSFVENGGFETGVAPPTSEDAARVLPDGSDEIDHWQVSQDTMRWTHESVIADAGPGQRLADLSSAIGQGAVSQVISTVPGNLYHVWFDLGANPYGNLVEDGGVKLLQVSAGGSSEEFSFDATAQVGTDPGQGLPWDVSWQKRTWRFVATDTSTILTFSNANSDVNSAFGVAIDNVVVVPRTGHDRRRLNVTIKGLGSVTAQSDDRAEGGAGPGDLSWSFARGAGVVLNAEGEDFARWRGDIGENDPQSPSIEVVMDNNLFIQADFVDLTVQIANVDTSGCPVVKATVLVTDPEDDDRAVVDLAQDNFVVYEDGVEQSILAVQQGTCSVAFCLLLDYSGGMYRQPEIVPNMESAALAFVELMPNTDVGEIIKFSEEVEVTQEFTHDSEALKTAILKNPDFDREATFLYDALWEAITNTSEQSGCKAVIVMSDGLDTGSEKSKDEVIEYAQTMGVPIIAVGFTMDGIFGADGEQVLRDITSSTGGLLYDAGDSSSKFEDIYRNIADALNNQYTITWKAAGCGDENDGAEHELEIIVVDNDLSYGFDFETFHCPENCDSN